MRALALLALALASLTPATGARAEAVTAPAVVALGSDGWLVPGRYPVGEQPDGNSVILRGREGLILIDSGRNVGHVGLITGAIFGLGDDRPVAIINTHWHLDHVSGNPMLKRTWPQIEVYGTSAIDAALTGFLAESAAASRKALEAGQIPETAVAGVKRDLATIAKGQQLRPDVVVDKSRDVLLAGRALSLRVAHRAATERDLWVFDAAARRAIVGDLVTLPAPFLDTACPEGWLDALGAVAASGAEKVVPGHGPVMDRAGFADWRSAFGDFVACARGSATLESCSASWLDGVRRWIEDDKERAKAMADYYGELIRSGKLDGYCKA